MIKSLLYLLRVPKLLLIYNNMYNKTYYIVTIRSYKKKGRKKI